MGEPNPPTPQETGLLLRDRGVPEALAKETEELLNRLEAAQYGAPTGDGGAVAEAVRALVKRLADELRDLPVGSRRWRER